MPISMREELLRAACSIKDPKRAKMQEELGLIRSAEGSITDHHMLGGLLLMIDDLNSKEFFALSMPAKDWCNEAIRCLNQRRPVPPLQ